MARPWFPFYPADYLAKTTGLTTEMHGAYMLLLMAYWANGGPLDDDDDELAMICRLTPVAFSLARKRLTKLFTVESGLWINKRMDEEIAKTTGLIAQKSAAGKASAQRRANTRSTPVPTPVDDPLQRKGNQPQPQLQPHRLEDKKGLPSKTDDDLALPDFLKADLRPRFDHVKGGAERFSGLGERPFKPKDPVRADGDMVKHLTSFCGMDNGEAWATVMAARAPDDPKHTEAARLCEKQSRQHKLGWFHAEAAE